MIGGWSEVYLRPAGPATVAVVAMADCHRCRTRQAAVTLVDHEFWGTCCSKCLLVLGD